MVLYKIYLIMWPKTLTDDTYMKYIDQRKDSGRRTWKITWSIEKHMGWSEGGGGGDDLDNGKFLFIIRNIYHIHIVCEQHNLFYGRFLLSTAQKVHTTWVTVNKHGGSTPRGKKWTTCVSSWLGLPLVCALCIHLLWKLCKWPWKCID